MSRQNKSHRKPHVILFKSPTQWKRLMIYSSQEMATTAQRDFRKVLPKIETTICRVDRVERRLAELSAQVLSHKGV